MLYRIPALNEEARQQDLLVVTNDPDCSVEAYVHVSNG